MLSELHIQNFAIIDKLDLKLGAGLIILTGETGAGKSIILDAVEMLVGGRADATVVRTDAEAALVGGGLQAPGRRKKKPSTSVLQREDLLDDPNFVTLTPRSAPRGPQRGPRQRARPWAYRCSRRSAPRWWISTASPSTCRCSIRTRILACWTAMPISQTLLSRIPQTRFSKLIGRAPRAERAAAGTGRRRPPRGDADLPGGRDRSREAQAGRRDGPDAGARPAGECRIAGAVCAAGAGRAG